MQRMMRILIAVAAIGSTNVGAFVVTNAFVGGFIAIFFASAACAQDGAYDPTFGSMGRTWIDITPGNQDLAYKLIRLPNGGFFMGGECYNSPPSVSTTCAAWLASTGALATGFGPSQNGTAAFNTFTGWPADGQVVTDAAALSDGRVIVMVSKNTEASYLALLRANGSGLDPSVGNGAGYANPPFQLSFLRVTPQQQIIAVGVTHTSPAEIVVARYNSDFRLDTSFGTAGSTSIGFSDGDVVPNGMTLQRDGKIVVVGTVGVTPTHRLGIVRMTANGQPDITFGINSDGRFESAFTTAYASGNDIVEDKKGRLVFAGFAGTGGSNEAGYWLVGRLLSGGAVDPGFNGGLPHTFTIASSSMAYAPQALRVALQSDNKIVVAGTMDRPEGFGDAYFALSRFNADGTFDNGFGGGGQSYGDMSPVGSSAIYDVPLSLVIVPGGIVVGGFTQVQSGENRFSAAKEQIDLLFADDFE